MPETGTQDADGIVVTAVAETRRLAGHPIAAALLDACGTGGFARAGLIPGGFVSGPAVLIRDADSALIDARGIDGDPDDDARAAIAGMAWCGFTAVTGEP